MMEFIRTMCGKRFFDGQLPALIKALERIAGALERQNKDEDEQVCEWKPGLVNDIWQPSCEPSSEYVVAGVAWFRVCPYCGRKIVIKQEEKNNDTV